MLNAEGSIVLLTRHVRFVLVDEDDDEYDIKSYRNFVLTECNGEKLSIEHIYLNVFAWSLS
jgi:hypothetical protein